jgi:hypothetical protein
MTREKKFALLVQTGVLLQELAASKEWLRDRLCPGIAFEVLVRALELQEEEIPVDLARAAREFLAWAYGLAAAPTWLPERFEAASRSA